MTDLLTERNRNMVSGAIGLLILAGLMTVGIKAAFGAYDGGYEVQGDFAAAGQGLISDSDVKIRGVTVGEVQSIELVENRALITLRIDDGTRIPTDARAVIRPKTLFGEKFVDILPGENELTGPYLHEAPVDDECPSPDTPCIVDTLGGFELEQVLTETFPILEAIDPAELAVVLDELADAGQGLGENINRSIVNGATLAELTASNEAELRQFTDDFALLAEELDALAPDLVAGARSFNVALPTINERADRLNEALLQLGRLAGDVADVLEANEGFTTTALTDGSRPLQLLFDERDQIQPLLLGLTRYTRTLSEAIRIEVGDGTMMAAIKNLVVVGGEGSGDDPDDGDGGGGDDPILDPLPTDELRLGPDDDAGGATDPLVDLLTGGSR